MMDIRRVWSLGLSAANENFPKTDFLSSFRKALITGNGVSRSLALVLLSKYKLCH